MGASQSTRRLTLVNDDKAGVIKVSEGLAHRLRGQIEESDSVKERVAPTPPPPSIQPQPSAAAPSFTDNKGDGWNGIQAEDARRALGRLQQEQDQAMASMNRQWQDKMLQRENEFIKTSELLVSETEKTASAVEQSFARATRLGLGATSCHEAEGSVLQCYKSNPSRSLNCAAAVQNLQRCVDLPRLESLAEGRA